MSEQQGEVPKYVGSENSLAQSNKILIDMGKLHYDLKSTLQHFEDRYQNLQRALSEAWRERKALLDAYFDLSRTVADLHDHCAGLAEQHADVALFCERLERVLAEHGLEYFEVNQHASFDPEFHQCAETATDGDAPPGTVIAVLSRGLIKIQADGSQSVVRPARVIVNQPKG